MAKEKFNSVDRHGRKCTVISTACTNAMIDKKTGRYVERLTLKPATPETKIRDPKTNIHLPADGKSIRLDAYWIKRIEQHDVLIVQDVTKKQTKPAPEKSADENETED